jgi:hypothetical protein
MMADTFEDRMPADQLREAMMSSKTWRASAQIG